MGSLPVEGAPGPAHLGTGESAVADPPILSSPPQSNPHIQSQFHLQATCRVSLKIGSEVQLLPPMRNVNHITVAVPLDLYRQTRRLAAEYDTTVTAIVAYLLRKAADSRRDSPLSQGWRQARRVGGPEELETPSPE
jgi:hypothetical protein